MALLPLALFCPLLVYGAYSDLREYRIPNALSLWGLALFVVTLPLLPMGEIGLRMAAGAIVFAIFFALFAFDLFGAGDTKILSVLMLFVPSEAWSIYGLVFSASMVGGILAVVTWQALPQLQSPNWAVSTSKGRLPMCLPIALSGIALLVFLLIS